MTSIITRAQALKLMAHCETKKKKYTVINWPNGRVTEMYALYKNNTLLLDDTIGLVKMDYDTATETPFIDFCGMVDMDV